MTAAAYFLSGLIIGVDVVLAYAWLTTRRANQNTRRVTLRFDTPAGRKALRHIGKPW